MLSAPGRGGKKRSRRTHVFAVWTIAAVTTSMVGGIPSIASGEASIPPAESVITLATGSCPQGTSCNSDNTPSPGQSDPNTTFVIQGSGSNPQPAVVDTALGTDYSQTFNYATVSGSQWVSVADNGPNCAPNQASGSGDNPVTTSYDYSFTLPAGASDPSLSIQYYADNAATVLLNGHQIGQQPQQDVPTNFNGAEGPSSATDGNTSDFQTGTNVLEVQDADYGLCNGIDYVATVTYADLSITKSALGSLPVGSDSPDLVYANDNPSQNTATFTIQVANSGPGDASDVLVADALPSQLTGAQYCQVTDSIPCTDASQFSSFGGTTPAIQVAAGDTATWIVTAQARDTLHGADANDFTNTASVTSDGPGGASATSGTIRVHTIPDPPSPIPGVSPLSGDGYATLEWYPSGNDGGEPPVGYTIQACPTEGDCITMPDVAFGTGMLNGHAIDTYKFTGLTNGVTYDFQVRADNEVGSSAFVDLGSTTPSTASFSTVIPSSGLVAADNGFSGGPAAPGTTGCPSGDITDPNCKNIVMKYSFTDPNDVGAANGLDVLPRTDQTMPGGCFDVSLEPSSPSYGRPTQEGTCGPTNKVFQSTYPDPPSAAHLESEQLDASVITYVKGAICTVLIYTKDRKGQLTPQCAAPPLLPLYKDPVTGDPTNMCPSDFTQPYPKNKKAFLLKPCAFVSYFTVNIPGQGPTLIGSSVAPGIWNVNTGANIVAPWCPIGPGKRGVPCVQSYTLLPSLNVQVNDWEFDDPPKGMGSG